MWEKTDKFGHAFRLVLGDGRIAGSVSYQQYTNEWIASYDNGLNSYIGRYTSEKQAKTAVKNRVAALVRKGGE